MFDRLSDFLDLYKFGNGSIHFCLTSMRAKAEQLGDQDLVGRIDHAIGLSNAARQKDYDWAMQKRARPAARRKAAERDVQIDRTIGQIHDVIKAFASMEGDSPSKQAAQTLQKELFEQGVAPIVFETFETQHTLVNELIERLRNHHVSEVDALGLTPLVDNLERLNAAFGREIDVTNREALTFDQVQAARGEAEDGFHRVVFRIFGTYIDDDSTRDSLLASVFDQNERIARYQKRRGTSPVVDPETGEVVDTDEPVVDADQPTPSGDPTDDAVTDPDLDQPADNPQPVPVADE